MSCDGLQLYSSPSAEVSMDGSCDTHRSYGEFCFEPDLQGSCAPSGGAPEGDAVPAGATTVCCAA